MPIPMTMLMSKTKRYKLWNDVRGHVRDVAVEADGRLSGGWPPSACGEGGARGEREVVCGQQTPRPWEGRSESDAVVLSESSGKPSIRRNSGKGGTNENHLVQSGVFEGAVGHVGAQGGPIWARLVQAAASQGCVAGGDAPGEFLGPRCKGK